MKQVIFTVDVEGHRGQDPVNKLIWGKLTDGKEYGINRIMDICDQYSVKGLFFVDIAEAWSYGEKKIKDVVKHIKHRGHDVGVHIHPNHMADDSRKYLHEYSFEEQKNIIEKCTNMFYEIVGEKPIAFRAGSYGANNDTLDIINEMGYIYDFSQFFGQKTCKINPHIAINMPAKYKNIIEIPVISYESFKFGIMSRYDKLDSTLFYPEFENVMESISDDERDIIVTYFYHSFSMLNWRQNPDCPTVNSKEEKKLIKTIEYVYNSKNYMFTSLSELDKNIIISENDTSEHIIKSRGFFRRILFLIIKAYKIRKYNKKARRLINIFLVFIMILLLFVSLLLDKVNLWTK